MKVVIEMDDGWRWWPVDEENPGWNRIDRALKTRKAAVEVDPEWFAQYQRVNAQYYKMQEQLEHLYRHQEGLEPFLQSPFHPNYKEE